MAATVLAPEDAVAVAALLAEATLERRSIAAVGAGTKLAWTAPATAAPPIETYLSTRQLNTRIEHYAGDLVATLPAGISLADANAALGAERQRLPLDPPRADRATIGGIVAANDSGPRRHLYGSTRDLIIGIELVLPDGRVARAGGRVVKNVAGYDLSRLICGSFGSLAIVTRATFKLAPMPPASRTVVGHFADAGAAHAAALAVDAAPVSPTAIEIAQVTTRDAMSDPDTSLLVRFETTEQAAARQAEAAREVIARGGGAARVIAGEEEAQQWRAHESSVWHSSASGTIVKLAVLPTQVPEVLAALRASAGSGPTASGETPDVTLIGRAALGVLYVRVDGSADAQVRVITGLRGVARAAIVLEAPDAVRSRVAAWPELGSAFAVMRAVKSRFDPHNVLNPGRGPGGL